MKLFKLFLCSLVLIFGLSGPASALVISDMHGDADGFGLGVVDGEEFDWYAVNFEPDDVGFTDRWVYGDQTWSHSYDISGLGTITSATLEVFTGGQGWYGLTQIYIDGVLVGDLTDGDFTEGSGRYEAYPNIARLDTFDLMPYIAAIDGAETLTVATIRSGDGWVLDYSKITLSDDGSQSVPEPSALLLLGPGLVGLAMLRRRSLLKK